MVNEAVGEQMDLGLAGRVIVVAAADGAEGAACAATLSGEGATVVVADQLSQAADAVRRTIAEHGRLDAVVACTPQQWELSITDVVDVSSLYDVWSSVEAIVEAFRAAVPSMVEQHWGRLVTVTTSAVKWLHDGSDELGALAGLGILGMHKAAVADVARSGITVNAVLRARDTDPADVADLVAFLVSDRAGYLEGVALSLDGAVSPAVF
ncbi:MAG: 3-oxoacyl-(acyl-carrier-protein) reductase [Acidimicrobiia bacterium]|nr:3-oxoacyl-(acyl-carrier-protein) reductase [Acidimicrobiia bacterium]